MLRRWTVLAIAAAAALAIAAPASAQQAADDDCYPITEPSVALDVDVPDLPVDSSSNRSVLQISLNEDAEGSATVTYVYEITNTSDRSVDNVTLVDDRLGTISTPATLAPGQTVVASASETFTQSPDSPAPQAVTNRATVTVGEGDCDASDVSGVAFDITAVAGVVFERPPGAPDADAPRGAPDGDNPPDVAPVTITKPPSGTPDQPVAVGPQQLPRTGEDSTLLLTLALGLVATGTGSVWVARRRS